MHGRCQGFSGLLRSVNNGRPYPDALLLWDAGRKSAGFNTVGDGIILWLWLGLCHGKWGNSCLRGGWLRFLRSGLEGVRCGLCKDWRMLVRRKWVQ